IFRQIISHDCLEESCGRSVGFPFHESLCNGEQCNCRVECSMRFLGEHSVVRGVLFPVGRQSAAVPKVPEDLINLSTLGGESTSTRDENGKFRRSAPRRRSEGFTTTGCSEGLDEYLTRCPGTTRSEFLVSQCQSQSSQ